MGPHLTTSEESLQELQILEQSIQSLLFQKQAFSLELDETERSLEELQRSGEEVYKIIGQMMIRSDKSSIIQELQRKKELLNIRINSLEKQESSLTEKLENLRQQLTKSVKK